MERHKVLLEFQITEPFFWWRASHRFDLGIITVTFQWLCAVFERHHTDGTNAKIMNRNIMLLTFKTSTSYGLKLHWPVLTNVPMNCLSKMWFKFYVAISIICFNRYFQLYRVYADHTTVRLFVHWTPFKCGKEVADDSLTQATLGIVGGWLGLNC